MAIVNRITKGSALTHAELDGNFTDLDGRIAALPNLTDSTADLDISGLITNNSDFDGLILKRTGQSDSDARVAGMIQADYTVDVGLNHGTGLWHRVSGTSGFLELGVVQSKVESYTDNDNYDVKFEIKPASKSSGTADYNPVLSASHDKVEILNTDAIELNSIPLTGLRMPPTAYADLPSNPDASANGLIAFLSTDGAGVNKNKLIYADGGNWKYVFDNSTVAAS